jgi:hypothetical protein
MTGIIIIKVTWISAYLSITIGINKQYLSGKMQ